MSLPDAEDPFERLRLWVATAEQLRDFESPGPDAYPPAVHEALVAARARLDTLERLLTASQDMEGQARRFADDQRFEADLAWDRACDQGRKRPVNRDFEGARERYSEYNLDTLPKRRAAHQAALRHDQVKDAAGTIRTYYEGLTGVLVDLRKRLGHAAWESHLERT